MTAAFMKLPPVRRRRLRALLFGNASPVTTDLLVGASIASPYPHPPLRGTFSRREKDEKPLSLRERGWGEGAEKRWRFRSRQFFPPAAVLLTTARIRGNDGSPETPR